ncbi:MAG: LPS translocon maturation chaperone LptM [Geminicoccaceae bacterium]
MSRSRCTEIDEATRRSWRPRRGILLALLLAPLAACGKKGPLELPPPEPFEEEPDAMENPDTYGDPSTFPEPGEDEELAE